VEQIQPLIEPHSGFLRRGDLQMGIADTLDATRRRQLLRRNFVLHFHHVRAHIHLGRNAGESRAEKREKKDPDVHRCPPHKK
jgi:hypothetical protein